MMSKCIYYEFVGVLKLFCRLDVTVHRSILRLANTARGHLQSSKVFFENIQTEMINSSVEQNGCKSNKLAAKKVTSMY